jgi:8-oxo-dGTP pyrophosphatase MutT (NUDIX family)
MIRPQPSEASPFTPAGFRALVRGRLSPVVPGPDRAANRPSSAASHDFDLDGIGRAAELPALEQSARPAAVLIPALARPELTLLLTLRTEHLPAHAGQIAFPGGKTEPFDTGPLATAVREANEEIGLDPALVEPLGALDPYLTGTGYRITPVIALIDPAARLTLDRNEVADTFEVPLAFLMDPANYQRHVRTIGGRERHFHAVPFGERFIWGATAGILRAMHQRLFAT